MSLVADQRFAHRHDPSGIATGGAQSPDCGRLSLAATGIGRGDTYLPDASTALGRRFASLWARICADADDDTPPQPSAVFDELIVLYAEHGRRYHTLRHIANCLRKLDEVRHLLDEPDDVEMALWFHDAIYVPCSATNEADSAVLAARRLTEGNAPAHAVERVRALILKTIYPSEVESDDQAYLCDIDLHSFGLPWEQFRRDGDDVRAEQPMKSDEQFACGQRAFMRLLLDTGHFYRSPWFREHYEATAQANVARFLEEQARMAGVDTADCDPGCP